jgi:hypothetical protein
MKDKPPRSVAGHTQVCRLGGVVGHCTTDDKNLSISVPNLDKRKTGQTCIVDYQDSSWVIDHLIAHGDHAWPASDADGCGAMGCRMTDGLVTVVSNGIKRTLCGYHALKWGDA